MLAFKSSNLLCCFFDTDTLFESQVKQFYHIQSIQIYFELPNIY